VDKSGIVHAAIGKKSFAVEALEENLRCSWRPSYGPGPRRRRGTTSGRSPFRARWAGRPRGSGGVRMMRTKAEKQEMVTALAARLRRSSTVYVTDFTDSTLRRSPSSGAGSGRRAGGGTPTSWS